MAKKTKKLILISALIILLAIISIFCLALSNANRLIAQFKPQLEESISAAIGSRVNVGEIKASIFPETAFKISSLSMEQRQSSIIGPKFDELSVKLDLTGLLRGEIRIKEVVLRSPQMQVVKTDQPKGAGEVSARPPAEAAAAKKSAESASKQMPLSINLDLFKIENGSFEFSDPAIAKNYKLADINLSTALSMQGQDINLQNFSVTGKAMDSLPLGFSFPALKLKTNALNIESFVAALSEQKISGSANFDLLSSTGALKLESKSLDLQTLLEAATAIQPSISRPDIIGELSPRLEARLDSADKLSVNADVGFKLNQQSGSLSFSLKHQDKKLNIPDLQLNFLGGLLKSDLQLDLDSKAFISTLNISDIQISSALELLKKTNIPLSGKISNVSSNLQGSSGNNLMQSLRGKAQLKIVDGAFKGFNLAGIVLKAVNNLPFLTGSLYNSLPASERASFDSSDTAFSELTGNLNFEGQGILVQNLTLQAPAFSVEAKGRIGFDSSLDFKATIYFSKAFSSMLVSATDKLKYGLDDQGRLVVPLTISGVPAKVVVLPDLQKLIEVSGKKVLNEKAGDIARGLLQNKKLGGFLGF